jgi:predicted DNA-binding ribbon-helix-helix protein
MRTKRNVVIEDSVWETLRKLGEERGMKISELIRQAIAEFIKREEG